MIARYVVLAARIRGELADLDRTATLVAAYWGRARTAGSDQDAFVSATALHLHAFYTGLERMFEEIAKQIDGTVLTGGGWHAELLDQMTLDLPSLRPPVLEPTTADRLGEYRRFRHRVRNVYAMNLLPERMASLVDDLPPTFSAVKADLLRFCATLDSLSRSDESGK